VKGYILWPRTLKREEIKYGGGYTKKAFRNGRGSGGGDQKKICSGEANMKTIGGTVCQKDTHTTHHKA